MSSVLSGVRQAFGGDNGSAYSGYSQLTNRNFTDDVASGNGYAQRSRAGGVGLVPEDNAGGLGSGREFRYIPEQSVAKSEDTSKSKYVLIGCLGALVVVVVCSVGYHFLQGSVTKETNTSTRTTTTTSVDPMVKKLSYLNSQEEHELDKSEILTCDGYDCPYGSVLKPNSSSLHCHKLAGPCTFQYCCKMEHGATAAPVAAAENVTGMAVGGQSRRHFETSRSQAFHNTVGQHEEEHSDEKAEESSEESDKLEEEFTPRDFSISTMLLGSVSFVMFLFQLVNYDDDDIRRYAWATVNAVISWFVTVLMFNSCNQWVKALSQAHDTLIVCVVQYIHLLIWVCICQLVLALVSEAITKPTDDLEHDFWVMADFLRADYGEKVDEKVVRNRQGTRSVCVINGLEVPVEKRKIGLELRQRQIKCWGLVFSRMAGFAAIEASGTMQQLDIFAYHPLLSLLPILINQCFLVVSFNSFRILRMKLLESVRQQNLPDKHVLMFDVETIECENEMSSLAGSVLFCNSLLFFLVNELPKLDQLTKAPDAQHITILYVCGATFWIFLVIVIRIKTKFVSEDDTRSPLARFMNVLMTAFGMCFAWCFLWSSRWLFDSIQLFRQAGLDTSTLSGQVLIALSMSMLCALVIWFLDMIDDSYKAGLKPGQKNPGAELVHQIVHAESLLAGFSWEEAFNTAARVLARKTEHPLFYQTLIAGFVFVVIVPVWQKHILQKAMQLELYYRNQLAADAKKHVQLISDP